MTIRIVEWTYYRKTTDLVINLNKNIVDEARQKEIDLFKLMHKDADIECYGEILETGYCLTMISKNDHVKKVWDVIEL